MAFYFLYLEMVSLNWLQQHIVGTSNLYSIKHSLEPFAGCSRGSCCRLGREQNVSIESVGINAAPPRLMPRGQRLPNATSLARDPNFNMAALSGPPPLHREGEPRARKPLRGRRKWFPFIVHTHAHRPHPLRDSTLRTHTNKAMKPPIHIATWLGGERKVDTLSVSFAKFLSSLQPYPFLFSTRPPSLKDVLTSSENKFGLWL